MSTSPAAHDDTSSSTAQLHPAVVIYQNPDFVSGLLQAILGAGLLESAETEDQGRASQTTTAGNTTGAKVVASVNFPGFGGIDAHGDLQRVRDNVHADETNRAQRLTYVFSQAYYLNYLRYLLATNHTVTPVRTLADARAIQAGDIIEYSSTFRANEINAVLDIATPELVSTVTKYVMLRNNRLELREIDDVTEITKHRQLGIHHAEDAAELASAIASALRQDFRSDHTREFYGHIATEPLSANDVEDTDDDDGEGDRRLTAVTICETAHFRTADPDRLLDGRFTVLGKVISPLADDVAVLDRNKLLDRIDPALLSGVFDKLTELSEESPAQQIVGGGVTGIGVDLEFSALIPGSSFAVLPIAIFA
ncbi:hypothetical protein [Rhodococcus sp. 14-2470-1a]|uniref:DUF6414 family protein n=1 Tax=Rhodococcus sp. 14-2470-1a TaxID=2023150 RepID=UPI000B9BF63E|nr:hypothetical protein [Rhodococcus sp. 14-2470-1a]OZF42717.1 hypothetical protein CH292_25190 [Rhodococcus sp. 14-2470-1a]